MKRSISPHPTPYSESYFKVALSSFTIRDMKMNFHASGIYVKRSILPHPPVFSESYFKAVLSSPTIRDMKMNSHASGSLLQ